MHQEITLKARIYMGAGLISIEEVARITNAPLALIERLIEEEIVRPIEEEIVRPSGVQSPMPLFTREQVRIIERSLRLHEDLGVNWQGVAIIEDLLERMDILQQGSGNLQRETDNVQEGECE